jgi:DNA-binding beta-propeller fold protein YncE
VTLRLHRGILTAVAIGAAASASVASLPACTPPTHHYEYVVAEPEPTVLRVYDIDDGHRLVRTVPLPGLEGDLGGIGASAVTDRLYVSSNGAGGSGVLLAYDLRRDQVMWTRRYPPELDGLCVTPDGSKIYVSSGEHATTDYFYVLDGGGGDVLGTVAVAAQTHNAICAPAGTRAYLTSVTSPYVSVVDTSDDHVVRRVGPFGDSVRPFTINGRETLTVVNVNHLIGFEVGSVTTGHVLWRVPVPGFPNDANALNPSHGVAFTPDEREVWVADAPHKALHVFDVTGLPGQKPVKKATIRLGRAPQWITFSLDGRFAYSSTGDVFDAATRKRVASIAASARLLEVDVQGSDVVRVASRHGLGYVRG